MDVMRETVAASTRIPGGRVGERLPELLWLAHMALTLHWVLDSSPDQQRTRTLIDGVAPLIARLVRLARLPVGRGLADDAIDLLDRVSAPQETPREQEDT